jgi:aspartate-semialdehyde dehydrogenase
MDELFEQTRGVYVNDFKKPQNFTKEIAFNVIPHIDVFMDDGFTKEEWKMEVETKKILDPAIEVVAHCVRVPVFIGHSEAVFIECAKPLDEDAARDILREAEAWQSLIIALTKGTLRRKKPLAKTRFISHACAVIKRLIMGWCSGVCPIICAKARHLILFK